MSDKKTVEEKAEEAAELEKAVESYEKLVRAADGETETMTTFDAQTYKAMLDSYTYRLKVLKAHLKVY